MSALVPLLSVAMWIVFTIFTLMETLPWTVANTTWISVSTSTISILIIIGTIMWVIDSDTAYDPYDY